MKTGLAAIDHIVVLMLENRSFDHMLGSLTLAGRADVDGLDGNQVEKYQNLEYRPKKLPSRTFPNDPGHMFRDVREQLDTSNGGFVKNFDGHNGDQDLEQVMGFYEPEDVPAFSFISSQYAICDRWFSSVPGPTHPNRLFALAGQSDGRVSNNLAMIGRYQMPTVFDSLGKSEKDWQFFYHDVPILWLFERYFQRKEKMIRPFKEFSTEVAEGRLAKLTWIDPHYGVLPLIKPPKFAKQNDDHPPVDIAGAQKLVRSIYTTLLNAPNDLWSRTVFVVTYDEHGGFYDHVPPAQSGDTGKFERYGVRVPTLVASAWTPPALCVGSTRAGRPERTFDHTSILKTIFNRFLPGRDGSELSPRVARARDLSEFLSAAAARTDRPELPVMADAHPLVALDAGPIGQDDEVDDVSFEESLRLLALMAASDEKNLTAV